MKQKGCAFIYTSTYLVCLASAAVFSLIATSAEEQRSGRKSRNNPAGLSTVRDIAREEHPDDFVIKIGQDKKQQTDTSCSPAAPQPSGTTAPMTSPPSTTPPPSLLNSIKRTFASAIEKIKFYCGTQEPLTSPPAPSPAKKK